MIGIYYGVKICRWIKLMLCGSGGCYIYIFYVIESYRCMKIILNFVSVYICVVYWRYYIIIVGIEWWLKMDDVEFVFNGVF